MACSKNLKHKINIEPWIKCEFKGKLWWNLKAAERKKKSPLHSLRNVMIGQFYVLDWNLWLHEPPQCNAEEIVICKLSTVKRTVAIKSKRLVRDPRIQLADGRSVQNTLCVLWLQSWLLTMVSRHDGTLTLWKMDHGRQRSRWPWLLAQVIFICAATWPWAVQSLLSFL